MDSINYFTGLSFMLARITGCIERNSAPAADPRSDENQSIALMGGYIARLNVIMNTQYADFKLFFELHYEDIETHLFMSTVSTKIKGILEQLYDLYKDFIEDVDFLFSEQSSKYRDLGVYRPTFKERDTIAHRHFAGILQTEFDLLFLVSVAPDYTVDSPTEEVCEEANRVCRRWCAIVEDPNRRFQGFCLEMVELLKQAVKYLWTILASQAIMQTKNSYLIRDMLKEVFIQHFVGITSWYKALLARYKQAKVPYSRDAKGDWRYLGAVDFYQLVLKPSRFKGGLM